MAVLIIAALLGGYILYTLWYSIMHECLDYMVLILSASALLAITIWCENLLNMTV